MAGRTPTNGKTDGRKKWLIDVGAQSKNLIEEKPMLDLKTTFGQAADLAEMRSLSPRNKTIKYLLCIIDVFT